MKRHIQTFKDFLNEAQDPSYYQETFYFTILISMSKDSGGSRDETKNDIRALPEVLTVTLVEAGKGGVQRDLGSKYLSTLKLHVRQPRGAVKEILMEKLVQIINNLRGISVLRYKEKKPTPRRKAFQGSYKITEGDYYQSAQHMKDVMDDADELTSKGPQTTGGGSYDTKRTKRGPWHAAPPGAPGGLEETQLDEAMKTAADLPEDVVVVVRKGMDSSGFRVYFALKEDPKRPLKAGDLDRMEAGHDIYGVLRVVEGRTFPYEGVYIVSSSRVKDGFGPLLYDVAMETAGKAGLKPDTLTVSDDASAVWKQYDNQRDDVDSRLLVMDLDQYHTVMPDDRAKKQEDNEHLAKAYFKPSRGITDDLVSSNKLVQLYGAPKEAPISRVINKDLSRFDRLYEDVVITIGSDDLKAFGVHDDLNQKVWEGDEIVRPGVKGALLDIVEEFMEGLDLGVEAEDVILTGSLANYNWSEFSDLDIHILVDFAEISDNKEMVKKFVDALRSNWNKLHTIMVKGHEVELYLQDIQEPHISSGVYSLLTDRWLVKPSQSSPVLDKSTATKKMKSFAREVGKLSAIYHGGRHDDALAFAQRLKDKLKRMRRTGLERSGIYAPENLAFKMLRRSGDIEQLFSIYTQAYDKVHSLDQ
jgi:hypothetical protein